MIKDLQMDGKDTVFLEKVKLKKDLFAMLS
jgi:hypothetical protein